MLTTSFVIITVSKAIQFHSPKNSNNRLKDEIDYIKNYNEFLEERTIKIKITPLQ